jgi:hypothetical protein
MQLGLSAGSEFLLNFSVGSASDEIISAYAQLAMKNFLVCSASDEIVSSYAQHAMKSFPRWLSMCLDVHEKTVKL